MNEIRLNPDQLAHLKLTELIASLRSNGEVAPIDGDTLGVLSRHGGWHVTGPWHTTGPDGARIELGFQVERPDEWGCYGCCGRTETHSTHPSLEQARTMARAGTLIDPWPNRRGIEQTRLG